MKIFIATNYPIIIKGLQDLLKNNASTIVAGKLSYTKPAQIIREIKKVSAQILILDLAFSKTPTNHIISQLKSHYPHLKIITLIPDQKNYSSILGSGANAYILASEIHSELIRAIEFITENKYCYYSPIIANMMAMILHQNDHLVEKEGTKEPEDLTMILTKRENEIFSMQAENIPAKEIANHFKIATSTVYTHLANINRKLDVDF